MAQGKVREPLVNEWVKRLERFELFEQLERV